VNDKLKIGFADRLKTAAAAKQILLAKFRPRPTVTDPRHGERADLRAARLDGVRDQRTAVKAAKSRAAAEATLEAERAQAAVEAAAVDAMRGERKQRKALSAAEAKSKRDEKYAARKARK
jgi:hypothetical protein